MIIVTRRKNEPFERLLRRFERKVKKSQLLFELKRRNYYVKPSTLKRQRQQAKKHLISSSNTQKSRKK